MTTPTSRATQATIALINDPSAQVPDADVKQLASALNVQINRDFSPLWNIDAIVVAVKHGSKPPAGAWQVAILASSDVANALGYHDLTSEDLPLGKAFTATAAQYGENWTVTVSHEVLEMLADPYLTAGAGPYNGGRWYAQEVCDPCEAVSYDIGGVEVSDFVTPAWFGLKPGTHGYNFLQTIPKPLALLPGGYVSYWTPTGGWKETFARLGDEGDITTAIRARPQVGTRRERRAALDALILPDTGELDDNWITSRAGRP